MRLMGNLSERNARSLAGRASSDDLAQNPVAAQTVLVASDDPFQTEELIDPRNAMQLLPDVQRDALGLVGAGGLSYEETTKISGCEIGTVKSRGSRSRAALAHMLKKTSNGRRPRTRVSASEAFEDIMREAASARHPMELAA